MRVDAATAGTSRACARSTAPAPTNEPIKMNADPGLRQGRTRTARRSGNVRGRQDGRLANVFVYVKDGLGNYYVRRADRAGEDRSEGLPLSSARVRHPRRPAARDRQQRPDAAQHPRAAEGERGVQHRPADPGHEDEHTFTAQEVMVPFKCDVHGWMNAYVGVLDHPVLRGDRRRTASSS